MPYLRATLLFLLLAVVTFAAYWNAWPDALVLDDKIFAGQERYTDLSRMPEFFREAVWAAAGDEDDRLYRPLLLVSIALDSALFPGRADLWHLENVLLHVLATLLVCALLLQLLRQSEPHADSPLLIAVLAAVVFGVHPVHAEVVNSIFNRSSLFVAIGSSAGLWWLLRFVDSRPLLAWGGIWLAYWFVLFSRETGVVLPVLAVALVWIWADGGWRQKTQKCLPVLAMAVPLGVYLAMRARAVASSLPVSGEGGLSLPDWSTVMSLAGIWLDALRLALWPQPLLLYHPVPEPMWWVVGLFVHFGLIVAAFYLYRRGYPGFIFGLTLFYVTLLPASRLFEPADVLTHLSERSLYEPSIGLVVLLALGLGYLRRRGDRLLAIAPAVLAVGLLTPLTWARNADWSSDLALLDEDYRHGVRAWRQLRALTAELVRHGKYDRAVGVCRENSDKLEKSGYLSLNCGTAHALTGDIDGAIQAYLAAARDDASRARAWSSLAHLYLVERRLDELAPLLEEAIAAETDPATHAYLSGLLLIRLYPGDRARLLEARARFEETLRLRPGHVLATSRLEEVERLLEHLR